jgi:hypothetical protein
MAVLKYYDGTDWEPVASALQGPTGSTGATGPTGPTGATPGLVLLNTTSFAGVTSQSINNVFSSTYSNYKIVINSNVFNTLNLRYRVSGSDDTTSNYNNAYYAFESRGIAEFNGYGEGATTHSITGTNCDEESYAILEIGNPFASTHTSLQAFLSAGVSTIGYKAFHILGNGRFRATTSFTGFTFYGSSNMTGSVSVYGYNK